MEIDASTSSHCSALAALKFIPSTTNTHRDTQHTRTHVGAMTHGKLQNLEHVVSSNRRDHRPAPAEADTVASRSLNALPMPGAGAFARPPARYDGKCQSPAPPRCSQREHNSPQRLEYNFLSMSTCCLCVHLHNSKSGSWNQFSSGASREAKTQMHISAVP